MGRSMDWTKAKLPALPAVEHRKLKAFRADQMQNASRPEPVRVFTAEERARWEAQNPAPPVDLKATKPKRPRIN